VEAITRCVAIALICSAVAACGSDFAIGFGLERVAFEDDLAFLRKHTKVIVLADGTGAQVVVAPEYQGRVMTSTTGGDDAPSFGWIGRAAIAARKRQPHMNVFGGEDRFWLGPEGGQYALYFKPGDPFDLEHWQVPEAIDWGPWEVASQSSNAAFFQKRMRLTNYADTPFDIGVDRAVRLLTKSDIAAHLGVELPPTLRTVAYESANTVTNMGRAPWKPETGLVSIWILGMFNPSPATTIALPFVPGPVSRLGPIVNDAYFGKVPPDRLIVKNSVVFFRGDGQHRSKIGLSASRAVPIAGSYDAAQNVLTLVQYNRPSGGARYVNSMWEIQEDPWNGDVVNSYNDGPPAPGKPPLGPFYELETSSPALNLVAGESHTHAHRTFHFVGPAADLDRIARATLKVGVDEMANVWGQR
jgi:hypothetical protein